MFAQFILFWFVALLPNLTHLTLVQNSADMKHTQICKTCLTYPSGHCWPLTQRNSSLCNRTETHVKNKIRIQFQTVLWLSLDGFSSHPGCTSSYLLCFTISSCFYLSQECKMPHAEYKVDFHWARSQDNQMNPPNLSTFSLICPQCWSRCCISSSCNAIHCPRKYTFSILHVIVHLCMYRTTIRKKSGGDFLPVLLLILTLPN